ncbi:MAG: B12-binding domain-containing radical SAM protein [Planctomycetes bacterium]|jgi:radical SAM superfamily enzyme YgiQ (UPF0313 family)|nr:B12-binding domain-containing radical SAM protein [Planctomycetota bacterium]
MNRLNVLLLNPPPPRIAEAHDAPDYPHLGLAYLAAYLRSRDCPVAVIDAKLERTSVAEAIERIGRMQPDLLGLTAYTPEVVHVAALARQIKERWPHIRIVLGGIHATVLPRETLEEFPWFDFLVFGEGEVTLHELVQALETSAPLDGIKGLGYRTNDAIHLGEPRAWNTRLDDLPFPAWDLFPRTEHYSISTTRGCPFKCIFCTRPYGSQVRTRSAGSVVREFTELVTQHGAKRITFRDETFGANRRRALEIVDALLKEGVTEGVEFYVGSRVDTVDEELLRKLRQAGCTVIGFGVESGNEEILRKSGKGITLAQARSSVALARRLGFKTGSYFILGFPGETPRTAWDTINFARQLNTDSVSIGIMIPFPRTEIDEMIRRGEGGYRRVSYRWADYNKQTGAVVELESMSRRTLVLFQILGYLMCYGCNLRFGSLLRILRYRFAEVGHMARNLLSRRDPPGASASRHDAAKQA